MSRKDAITVLRRRRDFLVGRILANASKDLSFDKAEAGALSIAIGELEKCRNAIMVDRLSV